MGCSPVDPHGRPTRGPHSHGLHVNVRWFGPDGHDCHEGECDVYNVDGLAYESLILNGLYMGSRCSTRTIPSNRLGVRAFPLRITE